MYLSVVVPVYNEYENIPLLYEAVKDALKGIESFSSPPAGKKKICLSVLPGFVLHCRGGACPSRARSVLNFKNFWRIRVNSTNSPCIFVKWSGCAAGRGKPLPYDFQHNGIKLDTYIETGSCNHTRPGCFYSGFILLCPVSSPPFCACAYCRER